MLVKPLFYDSFRCIADKCNDICCAGWEIDLDEETEKKYQNIAGDNGDWLRSKLTRAEDGTAVLCREGERCPFLRSDNLCEMIIRLGEDSLCHICREHPRFYTGTDNITEVGVGLCCEEAVRSWLCSDTEFLFEDDGYTPEPDEAELLGEQISLIRKLTNGEGTLGERLFGMIEDCGEANVDYSDLRTLFSDLEAMDGNFHSMFDDRPCPTCDVRFVKLAAYYVFRYYFQLGRELTLRFTAAALIMTAAMKGDLVDNIRSFSKEVEYDTDNIDIICDTVEYACGLGELARYVLNCG